ncbi:hypothetical protein GCM10027174_23880 [Salinifilum aidingensis]
MSEQSVPAGQPPEPEQPKQGMFRPEVDVHQPERQRRWTVLLRLLLLLPHFIVAGVLGFAAFVAVVIGWFAALFLGRMPHWISGFLELFVTYQARISASSMLLVDTYPPFVIDEPDYPVRFDVRPGRLNRWTVFFRAILAIPAGLLASLLNYGWAVLGFFFWLIVLVAGRTPRPIFDAGAAVLRFQFRLQAYTFLLTGTYPRRLFGDAPAVSAPGPRARGTRPLVLGKGGRALVIVFIVLGALAWIGQSATQAVHGPDEQHPVEYEHVRYAPGE